METLSSRVSKFRLEKPKNFLLEQTQAQALERYLQLNGFLDKTLRIRSLTPTGAGNMNLTLRAELSNDSTFIVKQARPWVEKYPQIDAPEKRLNVEAAFYKKASSNKILSPFFPKLLFFNPESQVEILEDLGKIQDCSSVYQTTEFSKKDLETVAGLLAELHSLALSSSERATFENSPMRKLNHAHIFEIPLQKENGLNISDFAPELATKSAKLKENSSYLEKTAELGRKYLNENSKTLIHGDFYPGSLVRSNQQMYLIDHEFAFTGPPEFDLGVFVGHLHLSKHPQSAQTVFLDSYEKRRRFDKELALDFAEIECLRRLIGYAQLPLKGEKSFFPR